MLTYVAYGRRVRSTIALPALTIPATNGFDYKLRVRTPILTEADSPIWVQTWRSGNKPWLSWTRIKDNYLLRFHDLCDFQLKPRQQHIECYPLRSTSQETIAHLFLNHVLPLALSNKGNLVLHASAVDIKGQAIAFTGNSGMGKSTLASSFCRKGFTSLTDDCLLIEAMNDQMMIIPSFPDLRLWGDVVPNLFAKDNLVFKKSAQYTEKYRLDLTANQLPYALDKVALQWIFFLVPNTKKPGSQKPKIKIEPFPPKDALIELIKQAFRLDIRGPRKLSSEFDHLSILAKKVRFRRLQYPHDFKQLPMVLNCILEHIA